MSKNKFISEPSRCTWGHVAWGSLQVVCMPNDNTKYWWFGEYNAWVHWRSKSWKRQLLPEASVQPCESGLLNVPPHKHVQSGTRDSKHLQWSHARLQNYSNMALFSLSPFTSFEDPKIIMRSNAWNKDSFGWKVFDSTAAFVEFSQTKAKTEYIITTH